MCLVPGDLPSQKAIRPSAFLAISSLRMNPAPLPYLSQSAGYSSVGYPFYLAYNSPNESAPLAFPVSIITCD